MQMTCLGSLDVRRAFILIWPVQVFPFFFLNRGKFFFPCVTLHTTYVALQTPNEILQATKVTSELVLYPL